MLSSHRNKIVAVISALVVVVGAGAAIGATGALSPKEESEAVVNDVADQLGVAPSELTAALKTALKNRVDAAVKAGRLTEAQGKELKARIDAGDVPLFGFGPGFDHHGGPHGIRAGLDAAADYLGMTDAQLRNALENGKTLAQVAKSKGKSVDGLVAAMVADAKEHLAAAVKAGRLTQAEADAMQADLKARITDMVNNAPPARPDGVGPGFGPPPGVAPDSSGSSSSTTAALVA
jgi:polyhydroxyalkanoate synthesis regulator phasin